MLGLGDCPGENITPFSHSGMLGKMLIPNKENRMMKSKTSEKCPSQSLNCNAEDSVLKPLKVGL